MNFQYNTELSPEEGKVRADREEICRRPCRSYHQVPGESF